MPVLGGVDSNLHLTSTVHEQAQLNNIATCAIWLFWAFFRDSFFLYFFRLFLNVFQSNANKQKNYLHFPLTWSVLEFVTFFTCSDDNVNIVLSIKFKNVQRITLSYTIY